MYEFAYVRPQNLEEAAAILNDDEEAKLLAGGMTLLPTLKQRLLRPSQLIDLAGVKSLRTIDADASTLRVGAMARHAEIAAAPAIRGRIPALAMLAEGIGDPHVRNRGTIGGSISNADPAADFPAAVVGLNATVVTTRRQIPGDRFFVDLFETALEPGEIVTAIHFPIPDKAAYVKFPNPASRYAVVGVFVARTGPEVRVAITGAAGSVFRAHEMETVLQASFSPDALRDVHISPDDLNSDVHAAADYRAHLIDIMVRRSVIACA
jgi:aerobic carbon-monoxide dehydrogenase medium subunit